MPDLDFQITAVEPANRGLTPLLYFKLRITSSPAKASIQGLLLNVQIQIQAPQRAYNEREKEGLFDLFGPPDQWGHSLRNRLWAHSTTTVGAFTAETQVALPVPCSFDLNVAATKYFYALENGEIPLLFLFSGSIFYATAEGSFQVERISWSKECLYRMPVQDWRVLMDQQFPNCGWLYLQRDIFDRLCAFKHRKRLASWDEAISQLLSDKESTPADSSATPGLYRDRGTLEVPA